MTITFVLSLIAAGVAVGVINVMVGVVMLLIIASMLLPTSKETNIEKLAQRKWLLWPGMLAIGFYGGFIQAGVGFLMMAVLVHVAGENLIRTNIHKVYLALIFTIPAFIIFILTDNVHWMAAAFLSLGSIAGGWLGAHMTLNKGEKAIRIALIIAMAIMAIRLFMPA